MAQVAWERPKYSGYDILEMETVAPDPEHETDFIRNASEHILILARKETGGGRIYWRGTWVMPHPEGGWHEVFNYIGPSADNGDDVRSMLRNYKEKITGRVA